MLDTCTRILPQKLDIIYIVCYECTRAQVGIVKMTNEVACIRHMTYLLQRPNNCHKGNLKIRKISTVARETTKRILGINVWNTICDYGKLSIVIIVDNKKPAQTLIG